MQVPGLGREIRPWSDAQALWRLYRMMRALRPDIVHTHTAKAGMLGRSAARLAGIRQVVHTYHGHVLRGYFGAARTAVFRAVEKRLARSTRVLIAVSAAVKDDLVALGIAPAERIRVIPLGLELEPLAGALPRGSLRGEAGVAGGAPLIGIVGRLTAIKDVPTFLSAAAEIRARIADARFAVVGDGELRGALEAEAARRGLAGVGALPRLALRHGPVYGDLDVVVNTSLNEGTPVALIEAMAAGRPVVATARGRDPRPARRRRSRRAGGAGGCRGDRERGVRRAARRGAVQARIAAARAYVLAQHGVGRLVRDMDGLYREMLGEGTAAA